MKLTRGEPVDGRLPSVSDCMAHRCAEHLSVPPLNSTENSGAECGVCCGVWLAGKAADEFQSLLMYPVLDAYADRLTHHALLRQKLRSARDRLNLLQAGAGDFLDEDDHADTTQAATRS